MSRKYQSRLVYRTNELKEKYGQCQMRNMKNTDHWIVMIRMVLVAPAPCRHPVTMTILSPLLRYCLFLAKSTAYWIRVSTSWVQSGNLSAKIKTHIKYTCMEQNLQSLHNLLMFNIFGIYIFFFILYYFYSFIKLI